MSLFRRSFQIALMSLLVSAPGISFAQEEGQDYAAEPTVEITESPEVLILRKIEEELRARYKNDIYVPPSISSLMFSASQQSVLREAASGFKVSVDTDPVTGNPTVAAKTPNVGNINSIRQISLGGIVFASPKEWTLWLNKKRVTPSTMPAEVTELRVYKEFIELKWFDASTNQIYPIRLRPNQTFHLDAQIFVPG